MTRSEAKDIEELYASDWAKRVYAVPPDVRDGLRTFFKQLASDIREALDPAVELAEVQGRAASGLLVRAHSPRTAQYTT